MAKRKVFGRRAKGWRELSRRGATRRSKDRILIVCEGRKTEPNYLSEVKSALGLTNADIEICGEGCDPKSIVQRAQERFAQDSDFDRIFCVFDKDGHATFEAAKKADASVALAGGKSIQTIKSVPCFEYWVLCHFEMTTAPCVAVGNKSPCQVLVSKVKAHLPTYSKGSKTLYSQIAHKTNNAITNAKASMRAATATGTDNPTTEMHLLIEYLRSTVLT